MTRWWSKCRTSRGKEGTSRARGVPSLGAVLCVALFFSPILIFESAAAACDLPPGEVVTIASVADGETVELNDGRTVRLAGIKAPAPPLGSTGEAPWPFVKEAKERLTKRLPAGTKVELRFDERRQNRHGHTVAQLYVVQGETREWLQQALVAEGSARVYVLPGMRACVPALLVREGEARQARRGLWRSWAYRVQDAADAKGLGRLTRTYQLVEGTVHAVGEGRRHLYVNFAPDWRQDFTIVVERKNLARFEAAGLDFAMLAGARVRVRGWVEWWNGPMIAATDPEQVEVLAPAS